MPLLAAITEVLSSAERTMAGQAMPLLLRHPPHQLPRLVVADGQVGHLGGQPGYV